MFDSVMLVLAASLLILWGAGALVYIVYRESALMIILIQLLTMGVLWFAFPFLITLFGG